MTMNFVFLFAIFQNLVEAYLVNRDCPVPELTQRCESSCSVDVQQCAAKCSDQDKWFKIKIRKFTIVTFF